MRALAVVPGQPGSLRLVDLPAPALADIDDGRGVGVRVLQVGLCGTDREISQGLYGAPPPGSDILVLGHENLGLVDEVGPGVRDYYRAGDYVVATVRRPGHSLYDVIGLPDLTTDDVCQERGINLLHGFLAERYVEHERFLVKVPAALRHVAVLLEPMSVVEKGIIHAFDLQRRLPIWQPGRVAVLGTGPVGLLAALVLRLRDLDVTALALPRRPYLNGELIEALGGRYYSVRDVSLREAARRHGPFDLIFEATGYSPLVFEGMEILGKNGVLVLSGISGGGREVAVRADAINLGFVLGNKVMVGTVNAAREHFEAGIRDLAAAEVLYPGWLSRLITHRVRGLEDARAVAELLEAGSREPRPIKAVVEVARLP
jgi:threonine dehydrogenase-like Zn-dependent dehydrogenase